MEGTANSLFCEVFCIKGHCLLLWHSTTLSSSSHSADLCSNTRATSTHWHSSTQDSLTAASEIASLKQTKWRTCSFICHPQSCTGLLEDEESLQQHTAPWHRNTFAAFEYRLNFIDKSAWLRHTLRFVLSLVFWRVREQCFTVLLSLFLEICN